jgi:hypothetical protein
MTESRQIAVPAYLVSLALILIPLADVMTTLFPWRVMDARWRFGAVGLISNALLLPMAGLLIAYVAATILNHATTRRVLGILGLLGALVGVVALGMFALDSLQTRASVAPAMRTSFMVATLAASIKTIVATITFVAIGIVALRGRKSDRLVKDRGVPLISIETAPASSVKSGAPPA